MLAVTSSSFLLAQLADRRRAKASRFGNGPTKTVIVVYQLHLSRLTQSAIIGRRKQQKVFAGSVKKSVPPRSNRSCRSGSHLRCPLSVQLDILSETRPCQRWQFTPRCWARHRVRGIGDLFGCNKAEGLTTRGSKLSPASLAES